MQVKRVFVVVLDSFGIGGARDAAAYGDAGSDTLAACARVGVELPNLIRLGLGNIDGVTCLPRQEQPDGAYGRMREASRGKDTTIGHWELAGHISPRPLPTYPNGFPQELLDRLSAETGRGILCNRPYSGTDVIRDYGEEHRKTGALIVYTSADSVMQIAAHEETVPLEELYRICQIARRIMTGEHAVGRIIARPFVGDSVHGFTRTANRHDFSLEPPADTMLDQIKAAGREVIAVGKIADIFAGRGMTETIRTRGNTDGLEKTLQLLERPFTGLCFVNLVDFDMLYGHRNNPTGYAAALEEVDRWLPQAIGRLGKEDLLLLTADHGCDPSTPSTDHSREDVPLLACGAVTPQNLGTRDTFADLAATVLEALGIDGATDGSSFWAELEGGEERADG